MRPYLFASLAVCAVAVTLGVHLEITSAHAAVTDSPPLVAPATPIVTNADVQTPPTNSIPFAQAPIPEDTPTSSVSSPRHEAIAADTPASTPKKVSTQAPTPKKEVAAAATSVVAPSSASAPLKSATLDTAEQYPERLVIPSINLDAAVESVGVLPNGEMDVPSGSSNDVGWYSGGPMPGSVGTAVLDAHVFAALKNLRNVKLGAPVYIVTKGGTKLRFHVERSTVYTLSELTPDMLFGSDGQRRLNLITCAGTFVPSINTYDHRLVDFAVFEGEELN